MIASTRLSIATALLFVMSAPVARAQSTDSASVDDLILLLRSRTTSVRVAAALELPLRGAEGTRAVPALRWMVAHDDDDYARSKAVQSLGEMGHAACVAVPAVIRLVRHGDPELRASAVEALGGIGLGCGDQLQDGVMLTTASRALTDPVSYVRTFALRTLDAFDHAAPLVAALRSRDTTIAVAAAKMLALREPTDSIVSGLFAALADNRRPVRVEAAHSLGAFGAPIRPALVEAAASSAGYRSAGAREALRYLEYAAGSPVSGRCYRLDMTPWKPAMDLAADTIFSTPPKLVRFSTVKFDGTSKRQFAFRVEPVRGRYSVHGPGYWEYSGDSVGITWSTGYSGLGMGLRVALDTLVGTASTFWDFGRGKQTADVRGIPIACGDTSPPAVR